MTVERKNYTWALHPWPERQPVEVFAGYQPDLFEGHALDVEESENVNEAVVRNWLAVGIFHQAVNLESLAEARRAFDLDVGAEQPGPQLIKDDIFVVDVDVRTPGRELSIRAQQRVDLD